MTPSQLASAPVEIRTAISGDALAIAELLAVLGYPAPGESIPDRLRRIIALPGGTALVASMTGPVVGLVTAQLIPSIHDDAAVALITTLVVAETSQGQGIGRQLVAAAETWAHAAGAMRIVVNSRTDRRAAQKFYESVGYSVTGVRLGKALGPE